MISIVVPARNATGTLPDLLQALASQAAARPPGLEGWEVIVADNGSTDGTARLARQWGDRLPLRVVDASRHEGAAAARNLGAANAKGHLLAFVDADDVVLDGWLATLAEAAVAGTEFATGPMLRFRCDDPLPNRSRTSSRPPVHLGFLPYAGGANLAIARSLLVRHGGFDEDLDTGEDVDLSWRVQLEGTGLRWMPGLAIAKRERTEACAVFTQYFRYGQGDVALARAYRPLGLPRQRAWPVAHAYLGLVARLPLLVGRQSRLRWLHQAGRRLGRLSAWLRFRTVLW